VQHKVRLEQLLTETLRKEQPKISTVSISSDGEFAVCNIESKYWLLKLSPAAKEFLRCGDLELIRQQPLFL
jgi:hypothetical protein